MKLKLDHRVELQIVHKFRTLLQKEQEPTKSRCMMFANTDSKRNDVKVASVSVSHVRRGSLTDLGHIFSIVGK